MMIYAGQSLNLGAAAFLLIHRRFHRLCRQTGNVGGSRRFPYYLPLAQ
jgi:hypothetical protein